MPTTKWVDFRHVRETVDFGAVLEAYGVRLKLKDDQHQGFCPLPAHEGQKRSPSFSANLTKKAFHCFGCQAQGNSIDFVALMEGLNPDDPQDIRRAALLIQDRFLNGEAQPPKQQPKVARQANRQAEKSPSRFRSQRSRLKAPTTATPPPEPVSPNTGSPADHRPHIVNAPLDFELKGLDPNHPYLTERGLLPATIQNFGLGYASRGMMAGRIAIPLHNADGALIGYAGRLIDDSFIGEESPKYRLPGSREREGTVYEFRKGQVLFNAHRIEAPVSDLVVVEGFFSVFHLHQCGIKTAVALMGSSCSAEQAEKIINLTEPDGRVWIMPDGDKSGELCGESVLLQVARYRFVRWINLEANTDPADYPREAIAEWLLALT